MSNLDPINLIGRFLCWNHFDQSETKIIEKNPEQIREIWLVKKAFQHENQLIRLMKLVFEIGKMYNNLQSWCLKLGQMLREKCSHCFLYTMHVSERSFMSSNL